MASRPVPQSEDDKTKAAAEALSVIVSETTRNQALLEEQGRSLAERKAAFAKEVEEMDRQLTEKRVAFKSEMVEFDKQIAWKVDEHNGVVVAHNDLITAHATLKEDVSVLSGEHSAAKADLDNTLALEEAAQQRLAVLKAEIESFEKREKAATDLVTSANQQADEITRTVAELQGTKVSLEASIERLEADAQNPLRARTEAEARVGKLLAEIATKEEELQKVDTEVAEAKSKLETVTRESTTIKNDLDSRAASLKRLEDDVDAKVEQLKRDRILAEAQSIAKDKGA